MITLMDEGMGRENRTEMGYKNGWGRLDLNCDHAHPKKVERAIGLY